MTSTDCNSSIRPHVWKLEVQEDESKPLLVCKHCGESRPYKGQDLNQFWRGYPIEMQVAWHNRYAEQRRDDMDKTPEEISAIQGCVQDLVDRGFVQTSRKYRRVTCIGKEGNAFQTLSQVDRAAADRIVASAWELFHRHIEDNCRHTLLFVGESVELSVAAFEAFRKARLDAGHLFP